MGWFDVELLARLFISCLCGIAMGYERNVRAKEAGVRTHCIVACAACLMMIVSKYGFFDLIDAGSRYAADVRLDPSRMAQGIVTGVGFLGAGIIYFQRGVIRGLTTAAGLWAISGVGMAIGAGMYFIGISATLIVLFLQIVFHNKSMVASRYKTKSLKVYGVTEDDFQEKAMKVFQQEDITVMDVLVSQNEEGSLDYSFCIEVSRAMYEEHLIHLFDYRCAVSITH